MEFAVIFLVGVVFGVIVAIHCLRTKSVGNLRIDNSDPDDGPYLFLELTRDVQSIYSKQYVLLRVNPKNFISHE